MSFNFLQSAGRAPWLPLLAVIALPFGRTVELFVLIMAIIGIYDLIKNHNQIRQSDRLKLFTTFFMCFWIPALLSLTDAVNIHHSASNVVGMLRFYFAGLFIINRLTDHKTHLWLGTGISLVLLFWAFDGWLQLIYGQDIFGLAPHSQFRISGVFGEDAKLGLMIIPFLGIAIAAIKERFSLSITFIFTLIIISAILISGDRSSWVSLFIASLFLVLLFRPKHLYVARKEILIGIMGSMIVGLAVISTPQFQARFNTVTVGFDGGYEALNNASSLRLPIWATALRMFEANPVNGVGARGFRYAYPDYALTDDIFVDHTVPKNKQSGPTQAHQIILEFMADTGSVGLIGYLLALGILFIKWRPIARQQQTILGSGYLVSLMAILFPINSHLSFFSSNWAQVIWFLSALTISALMIKNPDSVKVKTNDKLNISE